MANDTNDPTRLAETLRDVHRQLQRLLDENPHEINLATAAEHLEAAIAQLDPSSINPD